MHSTNFNDDRQNAQKVYEAIQYSPAWVRGGQATPQALTVISALENSQQEGFNPEDYDASHWPARLVALKAPPGNVDKSQLHLGIEALQTLTVVSIVFGSQATTYVIRGRQHLWGLRPGIWLVLSSVADILIISTLATFGIAMAPLPLSVIATEFGAAIAFGAILDVVKTPVFARLRIS